MQCEDKQSKIVIVLLKCILKRSLTEDTCCHVDNHRGLLRGEGRPADLGNRSTSMQTKSMSSYTYNTGAHHQVRAQKPLALRTELPVDNKERGQMMVLPNLAYKSDKKKITHKFLSSLS